MELRPGYKLTDAGVIPEDWRADTLGPHVEIKSGESPSLFKFESEGVPYFKVEQLNNNNKNLQDTPYFIRSNKKVSRGSLIFPKRGASILLNKIRILEKDSFMDTNLMTLTAKEAMCHEFLYYALAHVELWRIADTTSIPQINNKHITPLVMAFPPKAEQEAIAEALSDADALIESLDQLIAKKRQIKQGAMHELLTGKRRLPGFSGEWEVKRLGSVLKFQVGFPFSSIYFNETGQGIRLVKNRDLKSDDQIIYYSGGYGDNFLVKNGDVLIGMDGDFLPCLWSKGVSLLNQRVGRILPLNGLSNLYAFYFLIQPLKDIENVTSSTTVKHLSHGDIEGIEKPLPTLDEQIAIATFLSDMDAELAALESRLAKARQIKQGMMQELLTGRIRLL